MGTGVRHGRVCPVEACGDEQQQLVHVHQEDRHGEGVELEAWGLVMPPVNSNRNYLPMHDVCNNFLLLGNAKSLIFDRFSHMASNKHSF